MSERANKLKSLLATDPDVVGQLYDARVCNDISIKLYDLRKQRGITQKELAEELGVKQSNISRWEKPGYQGYKVKMLSKVARVLGGRLYISIEPFSEYQYGTARGWTRSWEQRQDHTAVMPDGSLQTLEVKAKATFEVTARIKTTGVNSYASV